jgi:hypothetical protein
LGVHGEHHSCSHKGAHQPAMRMPCCPLCPTISLE